MLLHNNNNELLFLDKNLYNQTTKKGCIIKYRPYTFIFNKFILSLLKFYDSLLLGLYHKYRIILRYLDTLYYHKHHKAPKNVQTM